MARLKALLERSGAKAVVASSWRKSTVEDTLGELEALGLDLGQDLIGVTPLIERRWVDGMLVGAPRWQEIRAWLDGAPERVQGFAILDDGDDMGPLEPHHVRTDPRVGLTDADTDRALRILGER